MLSSVVAQPPLDCECLLEIARSCLWTIYMNSLQTTFSLKSVTRIDNCGVAVVESVFQRFNNTFIHHRWSTQNVLDLPVKRDASSTMDTILSRFCHYCVTHTLCKFINHIFELLTEKTTSHPLEWGSYQITYINICIIEIHWKNLTSISSDLFEVFIY